MHATQLDLLRVTPPPARAKHRTVRETSRAQYGLARDRFGGRRGNVLKWLSAYFNRRQEWPTSGELAQFIRGERWTFLANWIEVLLYVRRGLSDLVRAGVIETVPNGARRCRAVGTKCCAWRVTPRQ